MLVYTLMCAAGCSSSTSVPQDAPPELGEFTYEVLDPRVDTCPTTEDGEPSPSALVRWSVDYTDVNGDLEPPFLMLWQSQWYPLEPPPSTALLTIEEDAISSGDPAAGTVTLRQCLKYASQESYRLWVWVLDRAGHWSDFAYLEIPRPDGAPAPPAGSSGMDPPPSLEGPDEAVSPSPAFTAPASADRR